VIFVNATNVRNRVALRKRAFSSRSIKEVRGLKEFELKTKLKLGAGREQLLTRAKRILDVVGKFDSQKTLVIFPLSKQGGNFYFAQGLLKVLAPKVRVVSLLTTGLNEHEKSISKQLNNLIRGRTNVVVFDDLNWGRTQANVKSALIQNGIKRENISYNDFWPNKLGSKMSAFIQRANSPNSNGVQLLQMNDANLIRLMYTKLIEGRKEVEYSEWKLGAKVSIDIFEHVLDKMHSNGIITQKVLNKAGLNYLNGLPKTDPMYLVDSKTQKQMPHEELLKRIFTAIPKSEINGFVKKSEKELGILKRAEYVKGIAAAKDILKERAKI